MHTYTDHFPGDRVWIGARIWRRKPDLPVQIAFFYLNVGTPSAHTAIQYRRGTTRTGEMDGAKEANGG